MWIVLLQPVDIKTRHLGTHPRTVSWHLSLTSGKVGSGLKNQEDAEFNLLKPILICTNMQKISSDVLPKNV